MLTMFLLVLIAVWLPSTLSSPREGCTAPLLLPDRPFFVVWNHPSVGCEQHGIHLGFENWGIVDNEKDVFRGEEITLFYQLGQWPFYQGQKAIHGGIPQKGNLTAHLITAKADVNRMVPNTKFSGLTVIDFESWRPIYMTNFDSLKIYKEKSLALAKERHPEMNSTQLAAEAAKEFENASRLFMEETLKELSAQRPHGKWGYYGYPRCWGDCKADSTIGTNDKMSWIFKHSTGLYPSIYFQLTKPPAARASFIKGKLKETLRVKAKHSRQDTVILPYALSQNGPYGLFSPFDLSFSIGLPADLGASGVVLWGSSASMRAKNECLVLQNYVNTTLGPYVQNISNFMSNCSQQNCAGHGRCVRKNLEAEYQHHLKESGRTECLIPEEELRTKNKVASLAKKAKENMVSDSGARLSKGTWFHRLYRTMMGQEPNQNEDVLVGSQMWGIGEDEFEIRGSAVGRKKRMMYGRPADQPVINFEIPDGDSGHSQEIEKEKEDEDYDQEMGNENGDLQFEESEKEKDLHYELTYDFDDYACKCFQGWAGTHCKQKQNSEDDTE